MTSALSINSLTDEVPEPDAEGGVTHTISRTVLLLEQNMKLYYTKIELFEAIFIFLSLVIWSFEKCIKIWLLKQPKAAYSDLLFSSGFRMVHLVVQAGVYLVSQLKSA